MANFKKRFLVLVVAGAVAMGLQAAPASAFTFKRKLRLGDEGRDVRQLQVRVAGWFERADQRRLRLTGVFNIKTKNAVRAFEENYGLEVDGVAGKEVFEILGDLEDEDRSTKNFDWKEFTQKYNPGCGGKANKYAGTFKGGKVRARQVRFNVKKLMWRLEAVRAKVGDKPIAINSGYRSVPYNKCIGGASLSQHMYGTAADVRVIDRSNRWARNRAKRSQVHGIACYASFTHNHFDLRLDNKQLPQAQYWWWPTRDAKGRDLDVSGGRCWGETAQSKRAAAAFVNATRAVDPNWASYVPSRQEGDAFEDGHEPFYNGHAD
jgi:zinc D-Ala-D-Ala carboxypeptidase